MVDGKYRCTIKLKGLLIFLKVVGKIEDYFPQVHHNFGASNDV